MTWKLFGNFPSHFLLRRLWKYLSLRNIAFASAFFGFFFSEQSYLHSDQEIISPLGIFHAVLSSQTFSKRLMSWLIWRQAQYCLQAWYMTAFLVFSQTFMYHDCIAHIWWDSDISLEATSSFRHFFIARDFPTQEHVFKSHAVACPRQNCSLCPRQIKKGFLLLYEKIRHYHALSAAYMIDLSDGFYNSKSSLFIILVADLGAGNFILNVLFGVVQLLPLLQNFTPEELGFLELVSKNW